jgi:hypothetical protein
LGAVSFAGLVNSIVACAVSPIVVGNFSAVAPVFSNAYVAANQFTTFSIAPKGGNTNSFIDVEVCMVIQYNSQSGLSTQSGTIISVYNSTTATTPLQSGMHQYPSYAGPVGFPIIKNIVFHFSYTQTTGTAQTFYLCIFDLINVQTSRALGSTNGPPELSYIKVRETFL